MSMAAQQAREQAASNASAVPYHSAFRGHRERMTQLVRRGVNTPGEPTLCVLGAGNAYDLELDVLAREFAQIHLVDLDPAALRRSFERQDEATRRRLVCHAPVELSGMHDRFERWARMELTPEELVEHAGATARAIHGALGRRFDVVLSACIASQMQLSLLQALGDRHPLFEALRWTLNVTHFRTLVELLAPSGRAFFVTDVTSDDIAHFGEVEPGAPCIELVGALSRAGAVFAFAEPAALAQLFRQDPVLDGACSLSGLSDAWVWENGPSSRLLVYALELERKS